MEHARVHARFRSDFHCTHRTRRGAGTDDRLVAVRDRSRLGLGHVLAELVRLGLDRLGCLRLVYEAVNMLHRGGWLDGWE